RNYMPAPQSNYVKVYTDGYYRGIYTNNESIGNDFLDDNMGSNDNSFFKCDPVTITGTPEPPPAGCQQVQGIASPLIYMGDDTACYKQSYEIKSDSDEAWVKLYGLINELNSNPSNLSQYLNVDRALWMLVFNNLFVNMDSYTGSGHNYYIYEDDYGHFHPLIWDLNENMGVFTQGLSLQQMQTLSTKYNFDNPNRPLIVVMWNDMDLHNRYYAHYRTMYNEMVASDHYKTRAGELRAMIDTIVQNDPVLLYSYNEFLIALDQNIGAGPMVIPGINVLMDVRKMNLSTHPTLTLQGPEISGIQVTPASPGSTDSVWIAATVTNQIAVWMHYKTAYYAPFEKIQMFDDGLHNDGAVGDGVFGTMIPPLPPATTVRYYLYAENADAGKFSPERAEYETWSFVTQSIQLGSSDLVINELAASNGAVQADENGEYDDWVEFYNNSVQAIQMNGMYLSDDPLNKFKWMFPDTVIDAGSYLIVWTDDDESQPGLHTSFKLSAGGEELYLYNSNGTLVDSVVFGAQLTDTTFARYPNGTGDFQLCTPTFAATNMPISGVGEIQGQEFVIYPNPVKEKLYIECRSSVGSVTMTVELYNLVNQMILREEFDATGGRYTISTDGLTEGVYFVRINGKVFKLLRL
ncbi:MAG: CotH kinase family protein, partial [Bacteroidetes bacterium]|nr:CotH kinase family protein [Bacteroidota bacterium]